MKFNPHEYQERAIEFMVSRPCAGLFASPGAGKTSTTLAAYKILRNLGAVGKMLVIAPLRPTYLVWPREVTKWDDFKGFRTHILHDKGKHKEAIQFADIFCINYEGLKWLVEQWGDKNWPFDMLVVDECFVRGTLISTPSGDVPIEKICVGAVINTDVGPRRVLDISRRPTYALVELRLTDGKVVRCTPEHPIFTDVGWVCAKDAYGRKVFTEKCVSDLRKGGSEPLEQGQDRERESVLLEVLRAEEEVPRQPAISSSAGRDDARDETENGDVVEQGAAMVGRSEGETAKRGHVPRTVSENSRRKRYWNVSMRGAVAEGPAGRVYHKLPRSVGPEARRLSYLLQGGFWRPFTEDSGRGRWEFAQPTSPSSAGPKEGGHVGGVRVESVSYHECRGGEDVWNLQVEGAPRYFAEGILVHNCTKVKNGNSQRFKLLKSILHRFKRRYILTGTPVPNGLIDLFAQMYVCDRGATLGPYITHYRNKYFVPAGYGGYDWKIRPGAEEEIYNAIAPNVMRIDVTKHLDLPDLVENVIEVDLPPKARALYDEMENNLRVSFRDGEVTAANVAVASMKCRQLACGGIYLPDGTWKNIHNAKAEAVEDLIEELSGQPALVAYDFKHDLDRLRATLGDVPHIGGGVTGEQSAKIAEAWNAGALPVLLGHPQSMSHGLNLQSSGNTVIWHSLTWNAEDHEQFIARIWRQGQKAKRVIVHYIVARNTIDEAVLAAIKRKQKGQQALLDALRDYWK